MAGEWAAEFRGRSAVVICQKGLNLSHGVAALLREAGASAEVSERIRRTGAKRPVVRADKQDVSAQPTGSDVMGNKRAAKNRLHRVPVADPSLSSIPPPLVMFVAPSEVESVAEAFSGAPFNIEGVFWSHRSEACTFDVMIDEFSVASLALLRLATIVCGADTARLDLAPDLLAASLGLSSMHADDLEQLEVGFALYDAFYRLGRINERDA